MRIKFSTHYCNIVSSNASLLTAEFVLLLSRLFPVFSVKDSQKIAEVQITMMFEPLIGKMYYYFETFQKWTGKNVKYELI